LDAQTLVLPGPVALVLSGGSSLGALHVGMLRAVLEAGIQPDLLVGTSVGAINAAFIGRGFTAQRVSELAELWRSMKTRDVFPGLGAWSTLRALLGSGTLASPSGVKRIIERYIAPSHADLSIPTAVVASDLASGEAVALKEGDLRRNLLASTAIPGVFPPVTIDGKTLVDGGVAAHAPLMPAKELGAASMVVLDTGYP